MKVSDGQNSTNIEKDVEVIVKILSLPLVLKSLGKVSSNR
jgi:hypothetical protein